MIPPVILARSGLPVHLAGEVEAEVCIALVDADVEASREGLTRRDPRPSALQAPNTSSVARAIPAAPTRRAMRRRGDSFMIGSCMSIPRLSRTAVKVPEEEWLTGAWGRAFQGGRKYGYALRSRCNRSTRTISAAFRFNYSRSSPLHPDRRRSA